MKGLCKQFTLFITFFFIVAVFAGCTGFEPELFKPLPTILRQRHDPVLQYGLERIVGDLDLQGPVAEGRLGLALVDLTNADNIRFAGVNENVMMYAASLPKIGILFALFKKFENGLIPFSEELASLAFDMCQISSNEAATNLFNLVGPQYICDMLTSPKYQLYDRQHGGGLWVGKEYGKGEAWQRDPMLNLSHAATASSVAHLYYLLETGQLFNEDWTFRMRAALSNSALDHKFIKGYRLCCPDAKVYRKSGSWRTYHSDSAIVRHGRNHYIIVAIANDPDANEWLEQIPAKVDYLVEEVNRYQSLAICPDEASLLHECPQLTPGEAVPNSGEECSSIPPRCTYSPGLQPVIQQELVH